eukprot:1375196-Amorphochlora_amoeboformis.AAC.1
MAESIAESRTGVTKAGRLLLQSQEHVPVFSRCKGGPGPERPTGPNESTRAYTKLSHPTRSTDPQGD